MNKREKYKPTAKTVVTEIRHFIVDAVRRVSAGRQSVSSEILDATLSQMDIVVGENSPYTLRDVRHVVSISTPSPVILELTAFGEIPPPESRSEKSFVNAKLSVEPILAGKFINVTLEDGDVFGPTTMVESFNTRSGETEFVELHCIKRGLYKGFIHSLNSADAGINFDGTMYCRDADVIRFTYLDAYNAEGLSENISVEASVTSPIKSTELLYNEMVVSGQELKIAIYNGGNTFPVVMLYHEVSDTYFDIPMQEENGALVGSLLLGTETTESQLGVGAGDVLKLTYEDAFDSTGLKKTLEIEVEVRDPETLKGSLTVLPVIKAYDTLNIELRDFDLFAPEATVFVNNIRTGVSTPVLLNEVWAGICIFRGKLPIMPDVALAGDTLEITYSDYGSANGLEILTEQVIVTSQAGHAEPEVEETPETVDLRVSKPVQIVVDGMFFLNGSFAGTLKLTAPDNNDVRCTIIKA